VKYELAATAENLENTDPFREKVFGGAFFYK
jgi:hypothetical protein